MLKPLRRKKVIKITMWLLIATFVIWGAGSLSLTGRNYVGMIFGEKISPQEYRLAYSAMAVRAKIQYGDNLSRVQKFLDLESQAWDRLILLYYAKAKRIKAGNKELTERIAQMPFFQSEGKFDMRSYNYIVQNIFGVMPREFEESVREDIIISKVIDSVQKDVTVTEKEAQDAYKARNEKADISYILITPDSFKNDVTYKEDELEAFYNSNKEAFRTQEGRNILYIKIPFLEKEGDQDKEKAKGLANQINDYLNVGEDFNALAKKYNVEVEETAPFSFGFSINKIGLSYPFSIASFSLSDEMKNVVVEDTGAFYVIKLKERIAPYVALFLDIKEDVKNALIVHKADALAKGFSENYIEILKSKKDDLNNLSAQIKVEIINAKDITRESYINNVGLNSEFNNACFLIKEGEFTGPIRTEKGYSIIRLDKLKAAAKEDFEKQKEDFKNKLLAEKRQKAFRDWFTELKKRANLKIGAGTI